MKAMLAMGRVRECSAASQELMSLCIRSGRRSLRSSIISFGMDAAFLLYSDGDVRGGDKVLYRALDAHGLSGRSHAKSSPIQEKTCSPVSSTGGAPADSRVV